MNNKTIGEFIAILRKSQGMTQKQLAEILNVSDKTISHWERNESSPDLSIIPVIAEIFGVSCDELLRGEKKPVQDFESSDSSFSLKSEKRINYLFRKQIRTQTILAIVSCGITLIALVVGFMLYKYYTIMCPVVIICCLFSTIISVTSYADTSFRLREFEEMENETTKRYRQKMCGLLVYPLLLNFFAAFFSAVYIPNYITAFWDLPPVCFPGFAALVCPVVIFILIKKERLYIKKLAKTTALKLKTIFITLFLLVSGTLIFWAVDEYDVSSVTTIDKFFSDPTEFKAYMETEKEPFGVMASTNNNAMVSTNVFDSTVSSDVADEPELITLYNTDTSEEWISFYWNNKEVVSYDEYCDENGFQGYIAWVQTQNENYITYNNIRMCLTYVIPIYYVTVIFGAILLYTKKKKKI